ncbi:Glutamate Aspartate periplasmic binding protein precursor GltI (TC 3.A.1.3.4) [Brevundimonas diminuta 3F5N]|uniref:Glutamate Aspartate periplasmic binding protein GltI (TC 3.A.1.3.4) n=2 Tax=Brevundimonas diminuta TaxID=293 RepID=A0A1R4GE73_BREDI|nr:Glutamate Aspartate periplasmic binding protein precursor GltI (TC 3.A.1.3.4) [Brevundimonas diminuta 3F5N]
MDRMRRWRGGAGATAGVAVMLALATGACQRSAEPQEPETREPSRQAPAAATDAQPSPTLAAVRQRGRLNCGVHEGLVGFAYTDNRGAWRGFDVDFCRATAAAIFGDPDAVRFVPLNTEQRFDALREGRVDVLWRNTSWTMSRDVGGQLSFAGINYYDGQGFMVRRALNLSSAAELNGARICVQSGSTTELNVEDYFRRRGIEYRPVVVATEGEARQAYAREECDAFTADISALAAARTTLPNPQQHVILPDVISKEPLGPVVRGGDDRWTAVVRWTLNALILAEELGVTRENAADMAKNSADPRVRRLLGDEGDFGPSLDLSRTWAKDAVSAGGNYGEIFNRNLGAQSSLDLERGLNAQWSSRPGGLIYGLPVR